SWSVLVFSGARMISVQFRGSGVGSEPVLGATPFTGVAGGFVSQSRTASLDSVTICLRYVYVGTRRDSRYGQAAFPLIAGPAHAGTSVQLSCRSTCSGIHQVFSSFTVSGLTSMMAHLGIGPVDRS